MKGLKYTAIVIVYNKNIKDSVTCSCLGKILTDNFEVIIVDNSTSDMGNMKECQVLGYKYISMGGNKGLSKAYNAAIENTNADVLILLDDDTEINQKYMEILNEAVVNHPNVDIFAPIVYGQDGVIYSPNEFNFIKNKLIKKPEQNVSQERFNAIASCLAIRKIVFDNYRFNESLFVDQIDQYFFCEQRRLGRKFMKIEAIIQQNFYQRGEALAPIDAWRRMSLRLVDIMQHARLMGEIRYIFLGFIKCLGLTIQIAIKSKSFLVFKNGVYKSLNLFLRKLFIHNRE